jgi:hypothetical protein
MIYQVLIALGLLSCPVLIVAYLRRWFLPIWGAVLGLLVPGLTSFLRLAALVGFRRENDRRSANSFVLSWRRLLPLQYVDQDRSRFDGNVGWWRRWNLVH